MAEAGSGPCAISQMISRKDGAGRQRGDQREDGPAQMKKDDGLDKEDGNQNLGEANYVESHFRSKTNRAD